MPVSNEDINNGISRASILARCQVISNSPLVVLDVAHNESSMTRLRNFIDRKIENRADGSNAKVYVVCGMLQDKEVVKSLSCFVSLVDHWNFATIDNERGATSKYLSEKLDEAAGDVTRHVSVNLYDSVADAYKATSEQLSNNDILVVFGSFFVAGDILKLIET